MKYVLVLLLAGATFASAATGAEELYRAKYGRYTPAQEREMAKAARSPRDLGCEHACCQHAHAGV